MDTAESGLLVSPGIAPIDNLLPRLTTDIPTSLNWFGHVSLG